MKKVLTGCKTNNAFNVSEARADELIEQMKPTWKNYVYGLISFGEFITSVAMNRDELLTNEKCFLTCHATQKAQILEFRCYITDGDFFTLFKELELIE